LNEPFDQLRRPALYALVGPDSRLLALNVESDSRLVGTLPSVSRQGRIAAESPCRIAVPNRRAESPCRIAVPNRRREVYLSAYGPSNFQP
jgi:hypothetical protein